MVSQCHSHLSIPHLLSTFRLNSYHFQKIPYGPFKGGYTHPYFVKGFSELCKSIKREGSNGGLCRSSTTVVAASPSSAPSPPLAHKRVISFDGHESFNTLLNNDDPMPTMTWDVETEGAFGDMSSSSRSEDADTFASAVDEIAAFVTSNLAAIDGSVFPFDPTPLPYYSLHPVANSVGGLRRGYSVTSSAILDQNDIAFFKNLFDPGTVSQEKEIMDIFFHENKERPSQAPAPEAELLQQQPTLLMAKQRQTAPTSIMSYTASQQQATSTTATPVIASQEAIDVPTTVAAAVSAYNFPHKLFRLLQDCDSNTEFQPICSWLPDGKQFKIHNKKRFVEIILPNYFDQTQYSSFRRQLNMYSFVRQSMSTYANPHFLRGHGELLNRVVRKNGSSIKSKKD
jgi:hypothetical protein